MKKKELLELLKTTITINNDLYEDDDFAAWEELNLFLNNKQVKEKITSDYEYNNSCYLSKYYDDYEDKINIDFITVDGNSTYYSYVDLDTMIEEIKKSYIEDDEEITKKKLFKFFLGDWNKKELKRLLLRSFKNYLLSNERKEEMKEIKDRFKINYYFLNVENIIENMYESFYHCNYNDIEEIADNYLNDIIIEIQEVLYQFIDKVNKFVDIYNYVNGEELERIEQVG